MSTDIVIVPDGTVVVVAPNVAGPSGPQGVKGDNSIADIAFAFQGNLLDAEQLVGYVIAHGMTLTQSTSIAKCAVGPLTTKTLTITKNGVSMGSVVFLAGQTTGTVTLTSTTLVAGDVIAFTGPSPADVNLSSITVTLAGAVP
jgi:hypothetical protein